jgi:hypothetical protein
MKNLCARDVAVAAATICLALTAQAQTTVKDPWARATVAQQKASGAFMQLQSAKGGKLLSASSPVRVGSQLEPQLAPHLESQWMPQFPNQRLLWLPGKMPSARLKPMFPSRQVVP